MQLSEIDFCDLSRKLLHKFGNKIEPIIGSLVDTGAIEELAGNDYKIRIIYHIKWFDSKTKEFGHIIPKTITEECDGSYDSVQ
jgi:hypothetical protein